MTSLICSRPIRSQHYRPDERTLLLSGDIAKNASTGPTGVTSKKFWTHPKKGTVMRLVKNPKTGKYENVYEEP